MEGIRICDRSDRKNKWTSHFPLERPSFPWLLYSVARSVLKEHILEYGQRSWMSWILIMGYCVSAVRHHAGSLPRWKSLDEDVASCPLFSISSSCRAIMRVRRHVLINATHNLLCVLSILPSVNKENRSEKKTNNVGREFTLAETVLNECSNLRICVFNVMRI